MMTKQQRLENTLKNAIKTGNKSKAAWAMVELGRLGYYDIEDNIMEKYVPERTEPFYGYGYQMVLDLSELNQSDDVEEDTTEDPYWYIREGQVISREWIKNPHYADDYHAKTFDGYQFYLYKEDKKWFISALDHSDDDIRDWLISEGYSLPFRSEKKATEAAEQLMFEYECCVLSNLEDEDLMREWNEIGKEN